jgi:Skp family chaperone for outer membrane proteins
MMRNVTVYLSAATLFLAGCRFEVGDSHKPQTLVVDPLPVAKSLGRDEAMQRRLNAEIDKLNKDLDRQAKALTSELKMEKQKLGNKPGEEATKHYQELVNAATQKARQSQLQAQQSAAQYRQSLLSDFNAEIRSAAAKIARERGATSVLIIGDTVLWFDPSADITADVIEKLRTRELQKENQAESTENAHTTELKNLESVIQSIEGNDKTAP